MKASARKKKAARRLKRSTSPLKKPVAVDCFLCGDPIPAKDSPGQYCYGCKQYICEKHPGVMLSHGHAPEDHDTEEDDAGGEEYA